MASNIESNSDSSSHTERPSSTISVSFLRKHNQFFFLIPVPVVLHQRLKVRPYIGHAAYMLGGWIFVVVFCASFPIFNLIYSLVFWTGFVLVLITFIVLSRSQSAEWRKRCNRGPHRRLRKRIIPASHVDAIELVHNRGSRSASKPTSYDADSDLRPALQIWIRMSDQLDPVLAHHAIKDPFMWTRRHEEVAISKFVARIVSQAQDIAEWFETPLIIDTKLDSEHSTWWPYKKPIPGLREHSEVEVLIGPVVRPRTSATKV